MTPRLGPPAARVNPIHNSRQAGHTQKNQCRGSGKLWENDIRRHRFEIVLVLLCHFSANALKLLANFDPGIKVSYCNWSLSEAYLTQQD